MLLPLEKYISLNSLVLSKDWMNYLERFEQDLKINSFYPSSETSQQRQLKAILMF